MIDAFLLIILVHTLIDANTLISNSCVPKTAACIWMCAILLERVVANYLLQKGTIFDVNL